MPNNTPQYSDAMALGNLTKAYYTHSGSESYYVNTDYTYDARNFLTVLTQNINGSTKTVSYERDETGVVEKVTHPSTNRQVTYTYDTTGRLIKVRDASGYYVMDRAGNRLSPREGSTVTSYTIGDHNLLTAVGSGTYTYDLLGNMVSAPGGWQYQFDCLRRIALIDIRPLSRL